jgi:hypothetical protein
MATELTQVELKRLARLGAQARLDQIEAERRAILRAFPGLSLQAPAAGGARAAQAAPKKKGRKRRKMTAEERKAVSDRMKKFWAGRKQQG